MAIAIKESRAGILVVFIVPPAITQFLVGAWLAKRVGPASLGLDDQPVKIDRQSLLKA
jgi:hypothetical protein